MNTNQVFFRSPLSGQLFSCRVALPKAERGTVKSPKDDSEIVDPSL